MRTTSTRHRRLTLSRLVFVHRLVAGSGGDAERMLLPPMLLPHARVMTDGGGVPDRALGSACRNSALSGLPCARDRYV